MPCRKCNGAWECGFDETHLCENFVHGENHHDDPWKEAGTYDGPTPVKVFLRKHKGECQVRFEPI